MQGTLFWITGKASLIEQSIQKNGKFLRFFEIWTTGQKPKRLYQLDLATQRGFTN
jgi:hypothetical protein